MALPPMTPGGQWIQLSPSRPPAYVLNPTHIERLLNEGGQIIPDPRREEDYQPPAPPIEEQLETEKAMVARLLKENAALTASMAALEPTEVPASPEKQKKR